MDAFAFLDTLTNAGGQYLTARENRQASESTLEAARVADQNAARPAAQLSGGFNLSNGALVLGAVVIIGIVIAATVALRKG